MAASKLNMTLEKSKQVASHAADSTKHNIDKVAERAKHATDKAEHMVADTPKLNP